MTAVRVSTTAAKPHEAPDLWAPENWSHLFPHRVSLSTELALLERLFPLSWRLSGMTVS